MYDSLVSEIVAIDKEFYSRKSYHDRYNIIYIFDLMMFRS